MLIINCFDNKKGRSHTGTALNFHY